jgi:hypothetical protein
MQMLARNNVERKQHKGLYVAWSHAALAVVMNSVYRLQSICLHPRTWTNDSFGSFAAVPSHAPQQRDYPNNRTRRSARVPFLVGVACFREFPLIEP